MLIQKLETYLYDNMGTHDEIAAVFPDYSRLTVIKTLCSMDLKVTKLKGTTYVVTHPDNDHPYYMDRRAQQLYNILYDNPGMRRLEIMNQLDLTEGQFTRLVQYAEERRYLRRRRSLRNGNHMLYEFVRVPGE